MPLGDPSVSRGPADPDPDGSGPRAREPSLEIEVPMRMSSELPAELATLRHFAGYEILGRIAIGGMAEVFLARERAEAGGARYVVLKVIRAQLATDPGFAEMFLNEGKVALGLRHPNVCHTYRFGVEAGHPFLAMELVSGVTVRDLIARARSKKTPMPAPIAAKIASLVAEALHSAHVTRDERGRPLEIVHQDVSPHNVMLAYDGTVKLLDFGVASSAMEQKVEAADSSHTTIRGKAAYLSPEQCTGAPVDARSDVFALGIVLYEMLTNDRLFKRSKSLDSMRAIASEALPAWPSEIPEPLTKILDRALARDPAERYQTAGAMQEDLEGFLAESRSVVTSARIADVMKRLLGEEFAKPPKIDASREVVAWLRSEVDVTAPTRSQSPSQPPAVEPVAARPRTGLLALGVGAAIAIALALGALAVTQGGATQGDEPPPPTRTREPEPVAGAPAEPGPEPAAAAEPAAAPSETDPVAEIAAPAAEPPREAEAAMPAPPQVLDPAEEEARARRQAERARRRAARDVAPGGFVDDPGF